MAACHWRSSVTNDASGEPGETPEYLALPTHARLCVGGPCNSLATRGTTMDIDNTNSEDKWRVSTEPSLSDHRQITFRIAKTRGKEVKFRNPKKTKWDSYREDLASSLKDFPKRHGTEDKLETCVDYLQRSLVNFYESNCSERAVTNSKGTFWWTPGLQGLRVAARRAWNRARNTGRQSDWELSRRALWNPDASLEAITLPDGTVVTGERCLEHLLEVNFPDFHREPGELLAYKEPGSLRRARQADWRMAAKIVMPEKVKWAINTFKPYKSAGPDGVFPALLQKDWNRSWAH
nr:PREDICTED: uncharacterized protein LOC105679214 [Linepithema humile]